MATALKNINTFNLEGTPQSEKAHPDQTLNAAGGYTFSVKDLEFLRRFLILGTEGGTFYVSENALSLDNAKNVLKLTKENHKALVDTIVEVSASGAAYRQDPALFSLAVASSYGTDDEKRYALQQLSKVARTGTHLFTFTEYVQKFRGWGRGLRRAVASWYLDKDVHKLAYQAVKYRQRNGWTHRDVLRLSHPVTDEPSRKDLFDWITHNGVGDNVPDLVRSFTALQKATSTKDVINLLERESSLSWEMLPNSFLKDPEVWKALVLKGMPMTALIRQLPRLTNLGILEGEVRDKDLAQLRDAEYLKKSRIHPMQVLVARQTYDNGQSVRGSSTWRPDQYVVQALDEAFYKTFDNVEPTGKRLLVAVDVSGSMSWSDITPGVSPREAAAAMALIYQKTEENVDVVGFSSNNSRRGGVHESAIKEIPGFENCSTLREAVKAINQLPMGGTDCALPFMWAMENGKEYDAVLVLTDNETWAGYEHPFRAAEMYRKKTDIPTKFIAMGMTATESTITNPEDPLSLSVVGFDPGVVVAINNFIAAP